MSFNPYVIDPTGATPQGVSNGDQPADFPSQIDPQIDPGQVPAGWNSDQRIDYRFEEFTGVFICPVAGPAGTPPKIMTLFAPYKTKVVKWTSEHIGEKWGKLPHWDPQNNYEKLCYKSLTPSSPGITMQGDRVYRVSGLNTYAIAVAPNDADTYSVPSATWDQRSTANYTITSSDFDKRIANAGSATY